MKAREFDKKFDEGKDISKLKQMLTKNENDAKRGQALYTKAFLALYDVIVLGFFCRFVWRCPSRHILELYNEHISANHLDIGVGTGYFLDHCRFPVASPRIALMDLNSNSLAVARGRLERYNPEVYLMNVLELDGTELNLAGTPRL